MDTVNTQALIQDRVLDKTRLEDGPLATRESHQVGDVQLWADLFAQPGTNLASAHSLGFYCKPASYLRLMEPFSPFS